MIVVRWDLNSSLHKLPQDFFVVAIIFSFKPTVTLVV